MHSPLRVRIWVVEPNDEVRAVLAQHAPIDAQAFTEEEFRNHLDRGHRPDALLIDGSTFMRLDEQRTVLDGTLRTLVVTGRHASELPSAFLERPSVRFVRKPFSLAAIERGLAWLAGGEDDAWADPKNPE